MKHPRQITESYIPVSADEVKPVVSKLMERLTECGFHGKVIEKPYNGRGRVWAISFDNPVKGRDWKRSRINCTGITLFLCTARGRDEYRDANGCFVVENGKVKLEGEPYNQHTASFRFNGTERRFHCRTVETIQDNTMSVYQYDDEWSEIDFSGNVNYLLGVL